MTCHHCHRTLDTRQSIYEDRDPNGHRRHWCSLDCIHQYQSTPGDHTP